MEDAEFRSKFLPDNYTYCDLNLKFHSETDFEVSFHADMNDVSKGDKWVRDYEKLTKTIWKVKRTLRKPSTQRKDYVCNHKGFLSYGVKDTKSENRHKNTSCQAEMIIKITSNTKYTQRYPWVKEGMPATVSIIGRHNHEITDEQVFSFRKIDGGIRDTFTQYFNNGLTVTSAIDYHINQLELDPNIDDRISVLTNPTVNPGRRTVEYLHDRWRKTNLGSGHGEGMWSALEKKFQDYTAAGASVTIDKDRNVIVVVTSLMRRAHMLSTSSEMAFVDSTASCDAENHTITFLMLTSSHGAVPGGVIITSGQREVDYVSGFSALKHALGDVAFAGKGFPELFMTDDSSAECTALQAVWPSAKPMLCDFHVMQAVWCRLSDAEHKVEKDERRSCMKLFRAVLYSQTIDVAYDNYHILINSALHQGFRAYVEQLWGRKESWCRAWCNIPCMRGGHANHFSKMTVRLFKEHVLTRCKSYNAVALVDFVIIVMDRFYRNRLESFANGRIDARHILLENLLNRADYIKEKAQVQRMPKSQNYLVPSESTDGKMYEVDPSVGCCTCEDGMSGRICKHQIVVIKLFEETFPNVPAVTAIARHECAILALGSAAEPFSFYARFDDDGCLHSSSTACNVAVESIKTEVPTHPPPSHVPVTPSDVSEAWKSFYTHFECLLGRLKGDNADLLSGIKKMHERLNNVHTSTQLRNFVHSSPLSLPMRHHYRATIHTRPTARRKRSLITRRSKRQSTGLPEDVVNKTVKRPRRLSINMNNVPDDASH